MKIFLVTGMHRSATSLLAKGLHDCKVHMGDSLAGKHPSNPWGHYEDTTAVAINDWILHESGGSWNRPPEVLKDLPPDRMRGYVERRSNREHWGVKDPRFCITWPLWLPVLREAGDLHVMVAWRTVEQVAVSLGRRDGMDPEDAARLAKRYHRGALGLLEAVG